LSTRLQCFTAPLSPTLRRCVAVSPASKHHRELVDCEFFDVYGFRALSKRLRVDYIASDEF
jgi:hypothetical protein